MQNRLGIIAGSGDLPRFVLQEAERQGYACIVAAIKGECDTDLSEDAESFKWFEISEVNPLISFFKSFNVHEAIFAGKIDIRVIFDQIKLGKTISAIISHLKKRSPESLIDTAIKFLSGQGIKIIDPLRFLKPTFCQAGILTKTGPTPEEQEDIVFGWEKAKYLADSDIGQTIVVKSKNVIAVEGIEGTDETIKRGGSLAGEGFVVVKVCRSHQDPRVDLPSIGMSTVKNIVDAGGRVVCFQADLMPFFQKDKSILLANNKNIAIVAKNNI